MNLNLGHTQDIIAECKAQGLTTPQIAYVLATANVETGGKMTPVLENLNYTTTARLRAVWGKRFPTDASAQPYIRQPQKLANFVYGGRNGNVQPNDGWTYRGRGYPQTTGRANYETSGRIAGVDAVANQDLMLDPKIAAKAMVTSMKEGIYTGHRLDRYINATKTDFTGARQIVNGTFEAKKVAVLAERYLVALRGNDPTRELQRLLGVGQDGIWGPKSQAALDAFNEKAKRIYSLTREL